MKRPNSRTVLKSTLFAGLVAVVFAAPAKSDFMEIALLNPAPARAVEAAPRLNLDIAHDIAADERYGRHQIEWQDPRSIQDPMDRERKIEPLFVVKF